MLGLEKVFPNLRELVIGNNAAIISGTPLMVDEVEDYRESNLEELGHSWPTLEKASFGLNSLYMPALGYSVRELVLVCGPSDADTVDPCLVSHRYQAVLYVARPLKLSIVKFHPQDAISAVAIFQEMPETVQRVQLEIMRSQYYAPGLLDIIVSACLSGLNYTTHTCVRTPFSPRPRPNQL